MPTHITVTAPEGRKTPISSSDGSDPGGALLYVEHGSVCRVRYSGDVRRSIARGDLIPVDATGKPTGNDLEKASAPAAMKVWDNETGEELELEKIFPERHSPARPSKLKHGDMMDRSPTFDTSDTKTKKER